MSCRQGPRDNSSPRRIPQIAPPRRPRRFEPPNVSKQRINEEIRVSSVLLIDAEGTKVGVVPTPEALQSAKDAGLDLVEVSPEARPPVCKVMDFGKFKYLQKRKQKSRKGHQSQIKEIRLRPKTDKHDLEVKMRQVREFIGKGDKVLVNMIFRGRELGNIDYGRQNLLRFAEMVEDIAVVESPPSMVGRRMNMTLRKK